MLKPDYSDGDLPPIGKALAEKLNEIFPSKPPDLSDEDRTIWWKAGQMSVVDFLIEHHKKQVNEDVHSSNS